MHLALPTDAATALWVALAHYADVVGFNWMETNLALSPTDYTSVVDWWQTFASEDELFDATPTYLNWWEVPVDLMVDPPNPVNAICRRRTPQSPHYATVYSNGSSVGFRAASANQYFGLCEFVDTSEYSEHGVADMRYVDDRAGFPTETLLRYGVPIRDNVTHCASECAWPSGERAWQGAAAWTHVVDGSPPATRCCRPTCPPGRRACSAICLDAIKAAS